MNQSVVKLASSYISMYTHHPTYLYTYTILYVYKHGSSYISMYTHAHIYNSSSDHLKGLLRSLGYIKWKQ